MALNNNNATIIFLNFYRQIQWNSCFLGISRIWNCIMILTSYSEKYCILPLVATDNTHISLVNNTRYNIFTIYIFSAKSQKRIFRIEWTQLKNENCSKQLFVNVTRTVMSWHCKQKLKLINLNLYLKFFYKNMKFQ